MITAATLLEDEAMSGKLSRVPGIFGVSFDPANSPERLNLKLAYVSQFLRGSHIAERFQDTYDVVHAEFSNEFSENLWLGKMPVDSWLTPRPKVSDLPMLTLHHSTSFLRGNGCWDYALRVAEFVEKQVFPCMPVMIGIDHSLTGGVLLALAKEYSNINVIVLDAHFDVMKFNASSITRGGPEMRKSDNQGEFSFYECGNFLSYILGREIIRPENLWVLGVGEEVLRKDRHQPDSRLSSNNIKEVKAWIDKGVHVLSKKDIVSGGMKLDLTGPTYISIDLDVGSLSSVFSARFMNCYGLAFDEFKHLLWRVAESVKLADVRGSAKAATPLLGLDIMEIDIHFMEAAEETFCFDYTRHIFKEIFHNFLEADRCS